MTNLIEKAINCDDGYRAAKITQDALGIGGNGPRLCTEGEEVGIRTHDPR